MTVIGQTIQQIINPALGQIWLKTDGAGAPTDAEFTAKGVALVDGIIVQNTVDGNTYRRSGGAWAAISTGATSDHKVGNTGADTTPNYLSSKLSAGSNVTLTTQNPGGNETTQVSATTQVGDRKTQVDASDTTPNYLAPKLVAGSNITLTVQNPSGNENIKIDAAGASSDHKVGNTVADTTPNFLTSKLAAGSNITLTTLNPGGNEQTSIAASVQTGDHKTLVDGSDTTANFLSSKIVAGTNITLTILNVGANEQISIAASGGGGTATAMPFAAYVIQYATATYTAFANTTVYSGLSNLTNSTPDLAVLVKACWDAMTPGNIYAPIIIMATGAAAGYKWSTQIAPISGMGLLGGGIGSGQFYGGNPYATLIQATSLTGFFFRWNATDTASTDGLSHIASGDTHTNVEHFFVNGIDFHGNNTGVGFWDCFGSNCRIEHCEFERFGGAVDSADVSTNKTKFVIGINGGQNGGSGSFNFYNHVEFCAFTNNSANTIITTTSCDENFFNNNVFDHCNVSGTVGSCCIRASSGNDRILYNQFTTTGGTVSGIGGGFGSSSGVVPSYCVIVGGGGTVCAF